MLNIFRPSTAAQPRQASATRLPADARGWCDEAGACEETGDWTRAVVCYRRALQLAPFAADIRQRFEDAVEQQILALERGPAKVRRVAAAGESKNNLFKVEENADADFELPDPPPRRSVRALTEAAPEEDRPAPLRKPARGKRNVVWIASACLAVLLTSAGLLAAAGTSSLIRGFFGGGGTPLLAEAKLPKALTERIAQADKLIGEEKTDSAATLLLAAKTEFPSNEADINRVLSRTFRTAGTSQLRTKNFEKAATSFEKASQFDPNDALNWIDRGRALREQARAMNGTKSATKKKETLTRAQTCFEKALELSPSDTSAYLGLAQVHDARNNRQLAIEAYQKIIDLAPQSNEARLAATALQQLTRR